MEEEVLSTTIGPKLAPFNPSHEDVVNLALDMMAVRSDDLVYDLGCGDGRVLVQLSGEKACRRFPEVRGVGVEYDLAVAQRAQKLTEDQELTDRISIIHGNALDIDFSTATAIFLYLLPAGMKALKERLVQALERGVRIVSYGINIQVKH
eukprot:gene8387-9245_t